MVSLSEQTLTLQQFDDRVTLISSDKRSSQTNNKMFAVSHLYFVQYRIYSRISREILGKIICKSLGGRLIPGARHQTKKNSA